MKLDATLEEYIKKYSRGRSPRYREIKDLMNKVKNGKLLLQDPDPPKTFRKYLSSPAYSGWLWTSLTLLVISLLLIAGTSYIQMLMPLRYVFGSILVLFLPGYALVEALYPVESDLSPLERLAFSIGLSLAIVPLIGLLLNYTPWGIKLIPITVSISLLTLSLLFIASIRKLAVVVMLHAEKKR